jgi:predicted lactoylglutathione lyase
MDQQQQQNVNQASQDWTEAAQQSFKTLADRTVSLQESNLWLTQSFFQQFVEQLQSQTQGNQQAFETLAEESANAYSDFLNSALSFYQQVTQVAQSNLQTAGQVAQQGMQADQQASALASGRAPQRALASAASWEVGRSVPISGPDAWAGDKPTASRYTAPDHEAAMQLIYELLSEDSRYDEETWPEIAEALDRDRPSHRKLFVD